MREKVETNQDIIAKAAGEHRLSVIAEKSMITVDQSIINDREARLRNITALREAADKAVHKYIKLSEPKDNSLTVGNTVKNGIKFAILGGIAGVFLCCFFYGLQFLMNGKLNDVSSLKKRYQTRILAQYPGRKKAGWIDSILNLIEGNSGSNNDTEIYLRAAAETLGENKGGSRIALTGTASSEKKGKTIEVLQKAEGVTILDAGDILTDPEAVRIVRSADSVILLEEKNVSAMSDIDRETELLHSMGIKLEGFIIA